MSDYDNENMFGLTQTQLNIMCSIERGITELDIEQDEKHMPNKCRWLDRWCEILSKTQSVEFLAKDELKEVIASELDKNINHTWFYLVMLEATLFRPYIPLSGEKEEARLFKNLKFTPQEEFLKQICRDSGALDEVYIERFRKTYKQAYRKASGKNGKIALMATIVLAVSATVAAVAGALAGPIAVAVFGPNFVGLHGIALTSACLAMAGGGAIAIGGAGMAGGVVAIVGGGALLGAAAGGAAVSLARVVTKSNPAFALSQAAKIEVVLREVLLNIQQDTQKAQMVMDQLKGQIHSLQTELEDLKLDQTDEKKQIANLKKSIDYLKRAYGDMSVFKSSYETGIEAEAVYDPED